MILLIDNYDSFVFNLARYLEELGHVVKVVRNDEITVAGVRALNPLAIVFSPGPCGPDEAGNSLELIDALKTEFPMLGVCLGHQSIAQAFGGTVKRAKRPVHGMTSSSVIAGTICLLD
jgi:anthranilate synthase component 2/para-aminobenzoate synthetase component 2